MMQEYNPNLTFHSIQTVHRSKSIVNVHKSIVYRVSRNRSHPERQQNKPSIGLGFFVQGVETLKDPVIHNSPVSP